MPGLSADVLIRLMGESRNLDTATRKGKKGLDGVDDSAGKADKSLGRLAARAATFAAGSVALGAITGWITEGTKLADTADAVRASWEKTFGESSKQLSANIKETANALGLADFEAEQMLLTTGQLAKSMGLTDEEAADLAETLLTASGDVAAFNGELDSGEEILNAFSSALKGEFDALEGVGVKLKQADVNQRALNDTGKESVDQLSKADLALATTALITEQLGDEFGALAEAIRDGTTQSNENAAEMKENQEEVGQSFQQVARAIEGALGWLIGALKGLGGWIGRTMLAFQKWGEETGGVLGAVIRFFSDLFQAIWRVGGGAERMAARFRGAFNSIMSPIRNVSGAIGRLSDKVGGVIGRIGSIRIPGFATGGTVPGGPGTPQLVMAHGGEQIGSRTKAGGGGGGGGDTYVINVDGGLDGGQAIADRIVDALQTYNRNTGPIAITTRNSDGIV